MIRNTIYLLALIFVIAVTMLGLITSSWLILLTILIAIGITIAIITLSLASKKQQNFWQKRSTEAGANALISTVAVLIIVGLINFIVGGYNWRFDLTENKLFTLAAQSQEIIQNLEQPLKVWVFDSDIDLGTITLLENYRNYSNNFQFQVVDPEIEIGLAEQFRVQSSRGLAEVYLESQDKKKLVAIIDKRQGQSLSEIQLTNAIANIKRDHNPYIYFLQGHGELELDQVEGGFTQAITELEERGYIVEPLNLATSKKIPDNAALIAIAKPLRKLFPQEITALQNYLNDGGNLLLMLLPNSDSGLTPILDSYGIKLDNRLIIDFSNQASIINFGYGVSLITSYGDHPITKNFGNGLSIFPESRPLKIIEKDNVQAVPFIISSENTWAESNLAEEEITFNSQEDIPGPLNIGIALTRKISDSDSKMIIFGNGNFATNGWFQQQLNGDIFLNSVDWLTGEDEPILSMSPREQTDRRINLSPLQAGIISWIAIRIMPLLGFAIAGTIWWRRR
ncbi:MAG: Gldg family protein [Xenococcus sp. MO_188.B8]|nr:Gldg family protein [Xenococcus sp. MO_188.B8]